MGEQPCPLCEGRYGTFRWCTVCSSLEQLRFAVLRGFEREDSEELGRRIRDFSSTLLSWGRSSWGARLQRQREGRTFDQVKAGGAGPSGPAGLGTLRLAEPAGPSPAGGDLERTHSASSPATTPKAAPEVRRVSRTPERRRRKESKRSRSSRRRKSPERARHRRRDASALFVGAPVPARDPPPPAPRPRSPAELPEQVPELGARRREANESLTESEGEEALKWLHLFLRSRELAVIGLGPFRQVGGPGSSPLERGEEQRQTEAREAGPISGPLREAGVMPPKNVRRPAAGLPPVRLLGF